MFTTIFFTIIFSMMVIAFAGSAVAMIFYSKGILTKIFSFGALSSAVSAVVLFIYNDFDINNYSFAKSMMYSFIALVLAVFFEKKGKNKKEENAQS